MKRESVCKWPATNYIQVIGSTTIRAYKEMCRYRFIVIMSSDVQQGYRHHCVPQSIEHGHRHDNG